MWGNAHGMTRYLVPGEDSQRRRRCLNESDKVIGMNELAIDGPVNDGGIRWNEFEAASDGFEHISRFPVGIDGPLNAEIIVVMYDVLGIKSDDGSDGVNMAGMKCVDDGT